MTDDEKLLERLLERRMHHSPGQARDLAEADFDWIKKKGAAPSVAATDESGSPSESSNAQSAFRMTPEHYARLGVDPDEVKRMSES